MIPYNTWCPITQILVFYDQGADKGVERLNISRTNMRGFHKDAWDYRAWDTAKKEDQWNCLRRIVEEKKPKKIGINESEAIWAADALTVSYKKKLIDTLGSEYAKRLHPTGELGTLWLETLLEEDLELYERAVALSHAIIAETFSSRAITPGVTTADDLLYHFLQRVSNLGLERYAWPSFRIGGRDPKMIEKYGRDDRVIRRGDLIYCDAGIVYLRYYTDHAAWAYVLRPGETDVPESFKKIMAEGNRLQDIFCAEFKEGLTGNQLLTNILKSAQEKGIKKPMIYSHSIGYYLHEPGPLIGLPWEQVNTGARGEVKLVGNSTFTAELSVTCPVPEWGKDLTLPLEQIVAFTPTGTYFMDGRQTKFYIVK
jgi:Xaa-Pro aminopeptidase